MAALAATAGESEESEAAFACAASGEEGGAEGGAGGGGERTASVLNPTAPSSIREIQLRTKAFGSGKWTQGIATRWIHPKGPPGSTKDSKGRRMLSEKEVPTWVQKSS